MPLAIQPITAQDVPIVEQLAFTYNADLDPQGVEREAVLRWIQSVYHESQEGRHFFWLGHLEKSIVGFISFQLRTNPFTRETLGFVEDMYIAAPFRRQGYATQLAQAAFTELQRRGAQRIQLDVLARNATGFAFWNTLGLTVHHHVLEMQLTENT